ncbi:porin [Paraburkholderia pallida]|uniref:Porin n=1 Tax=Paraburkholderia pallida TaxID=2547399 RepID=A0A4P7CV23_9BURK|nr:porin [Paraburkholderia pallida]QBQ99147.1 porin [Paraburkholderia pallida]
MRRSSIFALGFCIGSSGIGVAHAQSSVTLYGVVDSGILYKTHSGSGGSSWQVVSGGEYTSRFGLTGAEDLGGGLQATFQLESGIRVNNGTLINGGLASSAATVLFDRGATVGLKSQQFGGLLLGKNQSPLLKTLADLDVTGYSNFGSLNNLLYQNLTGYSGWQYSWVDNSVEYQIPEVYGLRGSAMYSFGGTAGDFEAKRVLSAGLTWRVGDLLLGGAYFSGNDPTGVTNEKVAQSYTVGANYKLAQFRFALDFANFKDDAKGTSINFYTGEVDYHLTPALEFSAVCIRLDDRTNGSMSGTLYRIGSDYSLSKQTVLYADVGYVKNNSLGTLGIQNSMPVGVVGKSQLGMIVGMRHMF